MGLRKIDWKRYGRRRRDVGSFASGGAPRQRRIDPRRTGWMPLTYPQRNAKARLKPPGIHATETAFPCSASGAL